MKEPTKEQFAQYRQMSRAYRKSPTPEGLKKLVAFGKECGIYEQGDSEVYNESTTAPAPAPEPEPELSPLELAIEQAETVATLRESGQTEAADKVAAMTPEQYKQARSYKSTGS